MSPPPMTDEQRKACRVRLEARRALAAVDLAECECGWLAQHVDAAAATFLRDLAQNLRKRRDVLERLASSADVGHVRAAS